ncbi:MAG: hypothetical protein P8H56_00810 [Crocinitomicaceae bacterium]|nr:hypothetical protein [Crocinitomicaceae bacterium]MDG1657098.1 hypothetical protein [Crocinitomicaceae bacterium]
MNKLFLLIARNAPLSLSQFVESRKNEVSLKNKSTISTGDIQLNGRIGRLIIRISSEFFQFSRISNVSSSVQKLSFN